MFKTARLKLTAWYLVIIMIVSFLFSMVIYQMFSFEIVRTLRAQEFRQSPHEFIMPPGSPFQPARPVDPEILTAAKKRLLLNLFGVNAIILLFSAGASYLLAGRTLKPIEHILEEHKRFTGDASHELRTPLTALRTSIEVALRDKDLDLPEARNMLESNLEEVDKLQNLSEHLLTLNRFDALRQFSKDDFVNLYEIYEAAEQSLRGAAENKRITIEYSGVRDLTIKGHKDSLVELLIILMDNAIKYSHEQGKIDVAVTPARHAAIIEVKDAGIGIAPKDVHYIFNRFYRADSSRLKNEEGGYGLGLSIAQKIVELHRGSITVDSHPGRGTTFIIKLPA